MKITIIFLFFSLMIFSVYGQDYKPLLTPKSTWHEYFTVWPEGNATLRIGGDSIVNGITYKKIFADPGYGAILDPGYYRLLREDTLEKKVYRLRSNGSEEFLHYDFNLMPGDTFVIREDTNNFIVLDSITDHIVNPFFCGIDDTPVLSIDNPKVFYFDGGGVYPVIWIEGIGSLSGLLTTYEWGGGLLGNTLLCHYNKFRERDFHYVFCEEPNPCEGIMVTNINEVNKKELIKIFPNPSSNYINIDFKHKNNIKQIQTSIFNLHGIEKITTESTENINISHLSKGIYFIKITLNQQQIYIQKIIKH